MTSARIPGHTLPDEGRIWRFGRPDNGPGTTRCSCGAQSPELQSTAQRKQWHRDHKTAVLRGTP
jgi:hypothetical protein